MHGHPWPKHCACGAVWSREAWSKLPYLARWEIEGGPTHELRHCPCHTTLAVDIVALRGGGTGARGAPHDTLAHLLAEKKQDLLREWTKRVLMDLPEEDRRLEGGVFPTLRHDIPPFIDQLIATLLDDGIDSRRLRAMTRRPPRPPRAGTSAPTLRTTLREWADFRAALLDLCEQGEVVLDPSRARLVHRAIDEAALRCASELHESPGG
jgi:hypothetical protein